MRLLFYFYILLLIPSLALGQTVLKNPGISGPESYEINDHIDNNIGFVKAKIYISIKERNGHKYYFIRAEEGNIYLNEIELNYNDLTTISEKRTNLKTNTVEEYYSNPGNGIIHFFNREKKIDKYFFNKDKNIYSRYAYFFSFRGFPFSLGKSVTFSTYVNEYGDVLTMKLKDVSRESVKVKAGVFDCYKLELSIGGWQSIFSSEKYYIYYSVSGSHPFIKYEQKDGGKWYTNELIKIN
jgi:hypothetical protein